MPELISQFVPYDPGRKFQVKRISFFDAGQDSYTIPPAQDEDLFEQLYNVLPPSVQGSLQRRWGYQLWSSDTTSVRRLYEFAQQAGVTRRIIGTAGDGTGTGSTTNRIVSYLETGAVHNPTVYVPSAGAISPRLTTSRDYVYFADGVAADLKKWNGAPISTFVLSAVANTSGGNTVYTGTNLSSLTAGLNVMISGFANAVNNGIFTVVSSTGTTLTVANSAGIAESAAGLITIGITNWGIAAPTQPPVIGKIGGSGAQSFALTSVANASAGNSVYTGTALNNLIAGTFVTITGFVNAVNNGLFKVISSTSTTATLNNPSGLSEAATASLTSTTLIYPTVNLNGWSAAAHITLLGNDTLGLSANNVFGFGATPTGTYTNPTNAIDGSEVTYAFANGQGTNQAAHGCVWSFAALTQSLSNASLNILSELPVTGTDGVQVGGGYAAVYYTLDAGTTWITVWNNQLARAKKWDRITLPAGQDLSKVQVMALIFGLNHMYQKVYEINIEAAAFGTGPVILTSGRRYCLAYNASASNSLSDISPFSSSTSAIAGGSINLSALAVSPDPQVDQKILLATADGGNTQVLYYVATLPNTTTTYLDNAQELTLLASNVYNFVDPGGNNFGLVGNQPPPNGQYPVKHRGRIYLLAGDSLYFSKNLAEITTPTGIAAGRFEEAFFPDNVFDVSNGAETGTGLFTDGDFLYIGTTKHVLRLVGDGPANFQPPQTAFNEGGVLNQECFRNVFLDGRPLGAMWITQDYRVYLSDFNTHLDVGLPIQDVLNTINPAGNANVYGTYWASGAYNLYILAIPTGSNTDPDTLCVFDLKTRKWIIWFPTDKITALLYNINAAGIPQMLTWASPAASSVGYKFVPSLIQDRVGNTPVNFSSTKRTSWLHFNEPTLRKVLNFMQVISDDPSITVTIEGASTAAQFNSPTAIVTNAPFKSSPFGDLTLYLAGQKTKHRFYRFTFVSGGSTLGVLREFDIRGFGFHSF